MDFGPAQPELLPGARNAIDTCLAIQPGERVALIADLPSKAVAASLADAIKQSGAICEGFLLEDLAPRPLKRAPQQVLDALHHAVHLALN
jgi:leucyl aminopeptidase (aminopeptidase T)